MLCSWISQPWGQWLLEMPGFTRRMKPPTRRNKPWGRVQPRSASYNQYSAVILKLSHRNRFAIFPASKPLPHSPIQRRFWGDTALEGGKEGEGAQSIPFSPKRFSGPSLETVQFQKDTNGDEMEIRTWPSPSPSSSHSM